MTSPDLETSAPALRRSDARANQARVLEAARQVFAEQGLAAEIKDIAERAGVGVATIYRGFGSKHELLQATIDHAGAGLAEVFAAAEADDVAIEGLRRLVEGMLAFAESYGWLIQAWLAGNEYENLRPSIEARDDHKRRAAGIIERAVSRSGATIPAEVVVLLIEGAVVAFTLRHRRQEPHPTPAAIADGIVSLLAGPRAPSGTEAGT